MLQSTPSRVAAVTAVSLFFTILMYSTMSNLEFRTSVLRVPYKPTIVSGWGDGWTSLLAPGEAFEKTMMRSPSGQFVFSLAKNGHLVFQDLETNKNTTLFSMEGKGQNGPETGFTLPERATWHSMLTRRGVFVVFYVVPPPKKVEPLAPATIMQDIPKNPPASTSAETVAQTPEDAETQTPEAVSQATEAVTQTPEAATQATEAMATPEAPIRLKARKEWWEDDTEEGEEEEEEDEEDDYDANNGLGYTAITVWDSNRLSGCHILPKYAPANSAPFLQLDDDGLLQISTSNEINCVLRRPDEERADRGLQVSPVETLNNPIFGR